MVSAEDAIMLVDAVRKLAVIVGMMLLVQLVFSVILSIYLLDKILQSDGATRTGDRNMTKEESLTAAREAWKSGNLNALRRIFGEANKDLDVIMDDTFQETLCAGKNFD